MRLYVTNEDGIITYYKSIKDMNCEYEEKYHAKDDLKIYNSAGEVVGEVINVDKNDIKYKVLPHFNTDCDKNGFPNAIEIANKYKFKIRNIYAGELKNKWVCVTIHWTAEDDECKFKYATEHSKGLGWDNVYQRIMFPQVKYSWESNGEIFESNFSIEIGLKSVIYNTELKYQPIFFRNLKYGAEIYFAPNNWDIENAPFFNIDFENNISKEPDCIYTEKIENTVHVKNGTIF